MATILKLKWRKWVYIISVTVLIGSSFSLVASSIYFFSHHKVSVDSKVNLLAPPIFDQKEVNRITTPWGIKLDLFKDLMAEKTTAEITHYYVNDAHSSWKINIEYSWENQRGNWIYELKYH